MTGACVSLIITTLTLCFSFLKLENLMNRKNATINTHLSALGFDEKYDLANSDFMIAFALDSWSDGVKHDPRYIQWTVQLWKFRDGVEKRDYHPVH